MHTLTIEIDQETYERLVYQAVDERRPIHWQAEVALRRAVGLPFPSARVAVTNGSSAPSPETASAVPA